MQVGSADSLQAAAFRTPATALARIRPGMGHLALRTTELPLARDFRRRLMTIGFLGILCPAQFSRDCMKPSLARMAEAIPPELNPAYFLRRPRLLPLRLFRHGSSGEETGTCTVPSSERDTRLGQARVTFFGSGFLAAIV